MNALTWLFLGVLTAVTCAQLWLAVRQISHVSAGRGAVPAMFAHSISLEYIKEQLTILSPKRGWNS